MKKLIIEYKDDKVLEQQIESTILSVLSGNTGGSVSMNNDPEIVFEYTVLDENFKVKAIDNGHPKDYEYFQTYLKASLDLTDYNFDDKTKADIIENGIESNNITTVNIMVTDYYRPAYNAVSYCIDSVVLSNGVEVEFDDYPDDVLDPYISRNDFDDPGDDEELYSKISDDIRSHTKVKLDMQGSSDS